MVSFQTKTGRKRLSTNQTDLALAKRVVKEARIEQIELSRDINLLANAASMNALCGRIVTSKDAFKEWEAHLQAGHPVHTITRYRAVVLQFLKKNKWPKHLSEIRSPEIDAWINSTESGVHAVTRNVHRSALNHFFKFCSNEGWCNNPVPNVRIKHHQLPHKLRESTPRRPFTPEEFERLIAVAKLEPMPYWYGMIAIGRYTGLRFGDCQRIETDSILPDKIVVWTDKKDRRVELPMPPELPPILDMLAKHPMNQPLPLPSSQPGRVFNQVPAETWSGPSFEFRRLANAAGLPEDLTFHCLRHTYCTELAKSGLPLKEIARRMGHLGESTTLHYLKSLLE